MKKCSKCKKLKNLKEFPIRGKHDKRPRYACTKCLSKHKLNYYRNNFKYRAAQKKCSKKSKKLTKKNNREKIFNYLKSHPCVSCGESDPIVLEFDHLKNKNKAISLLFAGGYSWKVIMREIKKCQVLCANCHRRKTAKQFGWYDNGAELNPPHSV
jgi:5-methylcytosine-specific restriction endonuclease McrA